MTTLTRAQIDAIVSAGAVQIDPGEVARRSQKAVSAAAVAASYGCVDWFIYPDSNDESDPASDVAAA